MFKGELHLWILLPFIELHVSRCWMKVAFELLDILEGDFNVRVFWSENPSFFLDDGGYDAAVIRMLSVFMSNHPIFSKPIVASLSKFMHNS